MTDPVTIRPLTEADAEDYSGLRLRALSEHPEAFGSSPENHPDLERIRERFRGPWDGGDTLPLGAFRGSELIGLCFLHRPASNKARHKGQLFQMYVAPEARREGVGRRLLERAIEQGRSWGLELIQLAATSSNEAAVKLYEQVGFERWGLEPAALKVGGEAYDFVWMVLRV